MKPRPVLTAVGLVMSLSCSEVARADPATGYWVVAGSVVAGASLTMTALTIDCSATDTRCQSWASLGIWGGAGVAAVGSFVGLLIVERDARDRRSRAGARLSFSGTAISVVGTF